MEGRSAAREVKVVLLGDTGVGKSSIVMRFVTNTYDKYSESTIGYAVSSSVTIIRDHCTYRRFTSLCRSASFMSQVIVVDGQSIKYQIWDT